MQLGSVFSPTTRSTVYRSKLVFFFHVMQIRLLNAIYYFEIMIIFSLAPMYTFERFKFIYTNCNGIIPDPIKYE